MLWYGGTDGRFSGYPVTVHGSYRPLLGDFNGDGRRDILWYGPGAGYDVTWYGRPDSSFGAVATTVRGTYQPFVGDYGGGYNPYGFIAHALGAIDGRLYTNSLEAFQRNYDRGFRVFECDLVRLADGTALLAHDGLEANYGLTKPFAETTWAELAGHKYLGRYTILRSQDLAGLLRAHPDIYVILDSKYARLDIYQNLLRQAPERSLRERIFPHVEDRAELSAFRTAYPLQNYVLALYHTQIHNRYDDPIAGDFTTRYRAQR